MARSAFTDGCLFLLMLLNLLVERFHALCLQRYGHMHGTPLKSQIGWLTGDEMAKTKFLGMGIYYVIEEKYLKHLIKQSEITFYIF